MNFEYDLLSFMYEKNVKIIGHIDLSDDSFQRFALQGKNPHKKDAFVYIIGQWDGAIFGDWSQGTCYSWWYKNSIKTPIERRFIIQEAKKKQEEQRAIYVEEAKKIYSDSSFHIDHPYVKKKNIIPYLAKQFKNILVIPLHDCFNSLQSLQFICPDGTKRFKSGTSPNGNYLLLGSPLEKKVFLCEGYATGCSLHQAYGLAVVCAFSAHNLIKVAAIIRDLYPDYTLIIAADNDIYGKENVGLKSAEEAAKISKSLIFYPIFSEEDKEIMDKPKDWNDFQILYGIEAIRKEFIP